MISINRLMGLAGVTAMMFLGATSLQAQPGGGNFDPAQMRQQMMDRMRERLEVTSDDDWKALEPLVQKVMDARRDTAAGNMRGMFRGARRGGGGDNGGDNAGGGGGNQRRGGFNQTPSPEADALQKAIDAKAPKAELKAALDKYVAARKAKQADLEKAQANLRKVLTSRQEAIATVSGLL